MRIASSLLTCVIALGFLSAPAAARPIVTLRDDGTVATINPKSGFDYTAIETTILDAYAASDQPQPEVLSVWTTFPYARSTIGTQFFPMNSDVKGIGFENEFGGDGTLARYPGGMRSLLLHNNVLDLAHRASIQNTPLEGFATYLFLLELTHNWGPAVRLSSTPADQLIGFAFHWSFWMDAGSPAGGNRWTDNGDGTFSTKPLTPSSIAYSTLDLYLMGLAKASEVQPFGVLENAVPPSGINDPFTGRPYDKASFPWFGATPFKVTATRRAITIDDVIAKNGPRLPAFGAAQTSWKLGIVLLVGKDDTADQVAAAEATFAPIADSLAPAFAKATSNRGTLQVVTQSADPVRDMGAPDAGVAGPMGGDCSFISARPVDYRARWVVLALIALLLRRALSRRGHLGDEEVELGGRDRPRVVRVDD